jgi:hypothetical protein
MCSLHQHLVQGLTFMSVGALTGVSQAIFAFKHGWGLVLVGRVVGWFGRGIKGPLRSAMMADSVPAFAGPWWASACSAAATSRTPS